MRRLVPGRRALVTLAMLGLVLTLDSATANGAAPPPPVIDDDRGHGTAEGDAVASAVRSPPALGAGGLAHLEPIFSGAADVRLLAAGPRHAYLATGVGVQVLDLADPAHPEAIAGDLLPGVGVTVLVVADGRLWVVDGERWLYLFSLADPARPAQLGQLQLPAAPTMVTAANGYLLAVCGAEGLWVVDARDPAAMAPVGHLPTEWITRSAAVAWPYVFLGERDPWEALLRVVDVSDPAAPRVVAERIVIGGADYLALDGVGRLVVAGPTGVVWTVDVRDPRQPRPAASLGLRAGRSGGVTTSRAYALVAQGELAYLGHAYGASAIATTAETELAIAGYTERLSFPVTALALAQGALLALSGDGGVWVFPLPLVNNTPHIGQFGVSGAAAEAVADSVALDRGAILVGRDRRLSGSVQQSIAELVILRLGSKDTLRRVASRSVSTDQLTGLAVARDHQQLLAFGRPQVQQSCQRGTCKYTLFGFGLGMLDISNLGGFAGASFRPDLHALGGAASGDSAFVVVDTAYDDKGPVQRFSRGVALFNLKGAQAVPDFFLFAPYQLDDGASMPTFADVAVLDGWVYATAGASGLQVFDGRLAPRALIWAGRWREPGVEVHGVAAGPGRLWLATSAGLVVLDATDPVHLTELAALPGLPDARAVAVAGDYGVSVVGERSLALLDASAAAPAVLHEAALPVARVGPTPAATERPARAQVAVAGDLVAAAVGHRLHLWRIAPGPPPTATPTPTATAEPTGTSNLPIPPTETVTPEPPATATATRTAVASATPGPGTIYLPRLLRE